MLVVVREGLDWSVVRLGTDGSLELAVEPRAGDEIDRAVHPVDCQPVTDSAVTVVTLEGGQP